MLRTLKILLSLKHEKKKKNYTNRQKKGEKTRGNHPANRKKATKKRRKQER